MAVNDIGKWLIIFGVILVILGAAFILAGKIPRLGKLPGEIYISVAKFYVLFPADHLDPSQRAALAPLVSFFRR